MFISDYDSSDEDYDNENLPRKLASWAISFNISHAALNSLLPMLQESALSLPKDSRTLLRIQKNIDIRDIAGGEYYYFSLQYWLLLMFKNNSITSSNKQLNIHVSIDGIPLLNSSRISHWPILGSIIEAGSSVFPIAVYSEAQKPNSIYDYLEDFLVKFKVLAKNDFIYKNIRYEINLATIIRDAPARAFVKCIKGHNGYKCCERCVQKGEWCGKIIFPHTSSILRANSNFCHQKHSEHYSGVSHLIEINFDMVTKFSLGYMHLVCLGVM